MAEFLNTMLEFNKLRTRRRVLELQQYFEKSVLVDQRFICPLYQKCRESISQGLNFYEGQLSHVGCNYDLKKNGKELQLVITGISYGHAPAKVDMTARNRMVLNTGMKCHYYSDGFQGGRNPHMRGTTLLLKRILLGEESLRNYADWGEEFVGAQNNHIFNMFALVNFLLCSAKADSARDRSSKEMVLNCSTHYIETLKILEPSLVIFQGIGRFGVALNAVGLGNCWQKWDKHLGYFKYENLEFVTCEFYHPAYPLWPWGDKPTRPYFKDTILPSLAKALKEIDIE